MLPELRIYLYTKQTSDHRIATWIRVLAAISLKRFKLGALEKALGR
jgi:hypothetical protein